jgi:hypothetical protein
MHIAWQPVQVFLDFDGSGRNGFCATLIAVRWHDVADGVIADLKLYTLEVGTLIAARSVSTLFESGAC